MSNLPSYLPDGLRKAAESLLEIGKRPHTDEEIKEAQKRLWKEREKAAEHKPYADAMERRREENEARMEMKKIEYSSLRRRLETQAAAGRRFSMPEGGSLPHQKPTTTKPPNSQLD